MKKCIIITSIIFIVIIALISYFSLKNISNYKDENNRIKLEYKKKYDSLNNDIDNYQLTIDSLLDYSENLTDSINKIKNNQNDNEKPPFVFFDNITPDSISNIFANYDISKRFD